MDRLEGGSDQEGARRRGLLLLGVLLVATILRVGWPTTSEFKFSEARLAALALEVTREGRIPLVGVPSSAGFDHSPVSVYLYVPAFLFGSNPIPATIYGGLVGVGAVALCWWLARRWPGGGLWAAMVASILCAASPWAVAFSRKIWQVVFVPPLTLVFIALAISALVRRRPWNLTWAIVVFALLVQVHPSAISLVPAFGFWLVVFWRQVRLLPLLTGLGLGGLTAVPFLIHQVLSGWPALSALTSLSTTTWDLSTVHLAWEAITGRSIHALAGAAYPLLDTVPQIDWLFNAIGWLAVGAALWLAWRALTRWCDADVQRAQGARVDLILLSWLVIPILFNLRHSLDLHLHFFVLIIPAAYLIIGRAMEGVTESLASESGQRVLRVCVSVGTGALAVAQVVVLVLMARFVGAHSTPGGFDTPLGYYLNVADRTLALAAEEDASEVLVASQGDSVVVDEIPAIFDVLLRDRVDYRFVDGDSSAVFPPHRSVVLLAPEAGEAAAWYRSWPVAEIIHSQGDYSLLVLDGAWPQEGLEPILGSRLFENGVELQGFNMSNGDAAAGQARLWLLWQVLWRDEDTTHFYAQLLSPEGLQVGQSDTAGYPTPYRQKGDRVISKVDISVSPDAPPGPYAVQVGMYVYPQVAAVQVIDEAGNPVGNTVGFGP